MKKFSSLQFLLHNHQLVLLGPECKGQRWGAMVLHTMGPYVPTVYTVGIRVCIPIEHLPLTCEHFPVYYADKCT